MQHPAANDEFLRPYLNPQDTKTPRRSGGSRANSTCDLRAALNGWSNRYRFDSDVLAERLTRQTLFRINAPVYGGIHLKFLS